jgi:excisionase family DNA binding protein
MTLVKKYANIKETSAYTGVAIKTLYDWAANGMIPSIKIGKKVLFDLEDVRNSFALSKRNVQPISERAEDKAKSILAGVLKPIPSSSGNKAYNGEQQHNQRDLSKEKGEEDE